MTKRDKRARRKLSLLELAKALSNVNLVLTWLRDPRFAGETTSDEAIRFLPVGIADGASRRSAEAAIETLIEIDPVGGHRKRISRHDNPDALARRIWGLSG